ncbi:hypothetical protein N24_1880 [Corynebacterium suranareeae]|uniref:Uncharacterized protein n=1 Tax=Corynebacterium suranareeae TaxID=2506452 RepID=A0A169RYG6_9CORY|nr:hypothetical protein [Corynebacterium suranareeae]BAU96142.1 hypothetical protein N24_1880 [Corynebacterium suranareeae]
MKMGTPENEVILHTWNRTTRCEVARDAADHRVRVTEITESRWTVHIIVSGVLSALAVLVLIIGAGLPLLYVPIFVAVIVMVVYALLRYEQRMSGTVYEEADPVEMDSVIWEGIKNDIAADIAARAEAKKAKKPVASDAAAVGNYIASLRQHMLVETQRRYHHKLGRELHNNPAQLEDYGSGLRGCECRACAVADKLDVTVQAHGVAQASVRKKDRLIIGRADGVDVAGWWNHRQESQRKVRAAKQLERDAQRKQTQAERDKEAERKRKAQEFVAEQSGKAAVIAQRAEKKAAKQARLAELAAQKQVAHKEKVQRKKDNHRAKAAHKKNALEVSVVDNSAVDEVLAYVNKTSGISERRDADNPVDADGAQIDVAAGVRDV